MKFATQISPLLNFSCYWIMLFQGKKTNMIFRILSFSSGPIFPTILLILQSSVIRWFVMQRVLMISNKMLKSNCPHFHSKIGKLNGYQSTLNPQYSGDLNIRLVWYSNGWKLFDHLMVRYSNAIDYWTKFSLVSRPPFEYQTSENWQSISFLSRCFSYSDVCYLNPHSSDVLQIGCYLKQGTDSN